ncbi:MAG: hypothetical protein MK101_11500 [Phycisphaerales bacterium]|nr:hypothetical protein [Phycisphaerales bacterium]
MSRPTRHKNRITDTQLACEAADSKDRVRRRLQAMLDEAVQEAPTGDLFAELPWMDSSRSGEFEAVGA